MKKAISLLLTAIMVFSLVPALFVRDGFAADDKYVRNKTSGVIYVHNEAGDAYPVVGTLAPGAVAKYVSVSGAFTRIANPSGYVKTSELSDPYIITLTAKGGMFLYDGTEHKVTVTLTNGDGFTVEYSTDGGKSWTTTKPALSDPGTLKVKVRACKDNVILTHKDVTLEVTQNPPEGTEITIVAHAGIKKAPVRTDSNASSAKIGTANEGEKYNMISREGSWYKIKFGTKIGYVYYWYVKVGAFNTDTDVEPDPTATLTAKGGTFVYDGKEHKVTATMTKGEGYTIQYSTDGGKNWTTKAPGLTEVGTLTVKVRATGGTHQIKTKDVVIEVLEDIPSGTQVTIIAHGSTTKAPVRSGTGTSTERIGTALPGQKYDLLGKSGSWYKIKFDGKPGFVYYWFVTQDPLADPEGPAPDPDPTIDPAAKLTVKGGTFMYDGDVHKVTYTLEHGTGLTVEFSTDGGKSWATKVPGLSDPGTLTVKARATGGKVVLNHKDVTLTVTKMAPVGTAITIVAHNGTVKAPVRSGPSNSATKIDTLPAGTHGTLTGQSGSWIKVKCGSVEGYVYEWFVKTGTLPPDDSDSTVDPDPTNAKLEASGGVYVYDGKAHKVTAKLTNGAGFTIEYSTNGGKKWSTTVPSLTEPGKLTVKVRATGGGHIITHEDVKLQVIEGIPSGTPITIVAHGTQTKAPVRAAASNSAEKIDSLAAGLTGKILKQEGSWYKVKVGEVTGYVYKWFVEVGTITVDD